GERLHRAVVNLFGLLGKKKGPHQVTVRPTHSLVLAQSGSLANSKQSVTQEEPILSLAPLYSYPLIIRRFRRLEQARSRSRQPGRPGCSQSVCDSSPAPATANY